MQNKIVISILLVSTILVSAAIGGWILIESRDGGNGNGGEPGKDPSDQNDDPEDNSINDDDPGIEPDPDPYDDDVSDKSTIPDIDSDDGNSTEMDEPDMNQTDLEDNTTSKDPVDDPYLPGNNTEDPVNSTDPLDGNNTEPDDGNSTVPDNINGTDPDDDTPVQTPYLYSGSISIKGIDVYEFDPWDVRTTRPDVFANGHISLFDILVYLDNIGSIGLEYHFDDDMNTFVIDTLNGSENWWYWATYAGGWQENNAWRMDLYPYKDNTTIVVHNEEDYVLDRIFDSFRSQIKRAADNSGRIIIPRIRIDAPSGTFEFTDVEVTSHNLRNDTFQDGVITAIDVIMSMGDQGLITYELKWYETIGHADPIKNYWVERINSDVAYGTCGFVYETGEENMGGFNHIHIPSDYRVLTSPEYELFFWICL